MPQLSTFHSQLSASPAALPHNSALPLWLSVDPLSDKYPGSSPYVYCADNPVRLVDVDGREIYEFDNYGNYIRTIMCEGHDAVCIVNLDTKDVAYSQPYANHANTITSIIDVRGYSLNGEVVHNHPSGTTIPSKKDVMQAAELEQKHPCIKFRTYVTSGRYLEYNGDSQYMEEFGKPLQRLEKHEK